MWRQPRLVRDRDDNDDSSCDSHNAVYNHNEELSVIRLGGRRTPSGLEGRRPTNPMAQTLLMEHGVDRTAECDSMVLQDEEEDNFYVPPRFPDDQFLPKGKMQKDAILHNWKKRERDIDRDPTPYGGNHGRSSASPDMELITPPERSLSNDSLSTLGSIGSAGNNLGNGHHLHHVTPPNPPTHHFAKLSCGASCR